MSEISERLTDFFIHNGVLTESDRATYVYCFQLLFVFVSNFLAILLIAAITKNLKQTILYLIGFWPLRMLAGGYHAKTPLRCFLMTLFFYLLFLGSLFFSLFLQKILVLVFVFFSILIIFGIAPVDSPNKPFRNGQRKMLQQKSRYVVCLLSVICLLGLLGSYQFEYALSCGMIITAISLILSVIQKKFEGGDDRCSEN